jgi:hypothetical protein
MKPPFDPIFQLPPWASYGPVFNEKKAVPFFFEYKYKISPMVVTEERLEGLMGIGTMGIQCLQENSGQIRGKRI